METLIHVTGGSEDSAARLFCYLWNRKYPNYRVVAGDGRVEMQSPAFEKALLFGGSMFPKGGVEIAALRCVDTWNAGVESITPQEWANICASTGLSEKPFKMEV